MGLYKRGPVWWMRFNYKGKQVRKSTDVSDKRLAEKIYAKVTTQIAEGKWFDIDEGQQRTFAELVEKYESTEFKELKSWQTVQSYLNQLNKFFGSYALSDINPAVIDEFKQMRKAKGVKPSTINRQLNILKRMLNLAHKRWLWLKQVPPIEMESKADNKRIRHLSFEEYHLLLEKCDDWLKGIVIVAAWTGLRMGNVINLKREQVNLFAKTISLDADEMKNQENLIIPICAPAFEVLKNVMKVARLNSPYVFCSENGSPYIQRRVQRNFKKATKLAGIENFRFHDLRHCFASWNRQAGVDLDTLADLMGHKDTRMTRRYAHITPAHLKSAVSLLENNYAKFSTNLAQCTKKGASENR